MAYAQPLAKMVLQGTLFNGVEQWSTSLTLHPFGQTGALPPPNLLAPAVSKWFTAASTRIMNTCRLHVIKLNQVDAAGKYLDQTRTIQHEISSQGLPGSSNLSIHPQLSLAVSLITEAQRGRAHRGRFYPPVPVMGVNYETGEILSTDRVNFTVAAAQLIRDINEVTAPWAVCVASGLDGSVRRVTAVEVGSVMDTQRRRRNSIPETYHQVSTALDPGQVTP